jgi:hypothetical protein
LNVPKTPVEGEEELVEQHMGMLRSYTFRRRGEYRFLRKYISPEEYEQIARLSVLYAIRTFDPNRGTKLSTLVYKALGWGFSKARNFYQKHKLYLLGDLTQASHVDDQGPDYIPLLADEDIFVNLVEAKDLAEALGEYPLLQRRFNGETMNSIAIDLGRSPTGIRIKLAAEAKKLLKKLKELKCIKHYQECPILWEYATFHNISDLKEFPYRCCTGETKKDPTTTDGQEIILSSETWTSLLI